MGSAGNMTRRSGSQARGAHWGLMVAKLDARVCHYICCPQTKDAIKLIQVAFIAPDFKP